MIEGIYQAYPRKAGKAKARKAIEKAREARNSLEVILRDAKPVDGLEVLSQRKNNL